MIAAGSVEGAALTGNTNAQGAAPAAQAGENQDSRKNFNYPLVRVSQQVYYVYMLKQHPIIQFVSIQT
jgi:hypothetical protein